jgi:tetratricopeptide (TPR) repeat protein
MKRIFIGTILFVFICCKNNPNGGSLSHSQMHERAMELYKQEKYETAKYYFDKLILADSTNGEYYFKRGYSKSILLYDLRSAMEDYQKAIDFNYVNKKSAFLNLGTLYRLMGKLDSAIYCFDKSLEIDSSNEKVRLEKDEVLKILKLRDDE